MTITLNLSASELERGALESLTREMRDKLRLMSVDASLVERVVEEGTEVKGFPFPELTGHIHISDVKDFCMYVSLVIQAAQPLIRIRKCGDLVIEIMRGKKSANITASDLKAETSSDAYKKIEPLLENAEEAKKLAEELGKTYGKM